MSYVLCGALREVMGYALCVQATGQTCSELRSDVSMLMKQLHQASPVSAVPAHSASMQLPDIYIDGLISDENGTHALDPDAVQASAPSAQEAPAAAQPLHQALHRAVAELQADGLSSEMLQRHKEQGQQVQKQQSMVRRAS